MMTSKYANSYFEFQGQYDNVKVYLMAKWDMKSYLRLILYLNMKQMRVPFQQKSYNNGFCRGIFLPIHAMHYKSSRVQ